MKKYIHIAFAFLFTACSSTEIVQKVREIGTLGGQPSPIEEVSGKGTLPEKTKESLEMKVSTEKEVVKIQELNETKVREIIDAVRMNVKQGSKKDFVAKESIDLEAGKYAMIQTGGEIQDLKLLLAPRRTSSTLKKEGKQIAFRSMYQAPYLITWKNELGAEKQIVVNNSLKYKFTEEQNYAIIKKYFQEEKAKALGEALFLYQLAFSEGKYMREAMLLQLKLALAQGDKKVLKENLSYWEKLEGFRSEEESVLAKAREVLGLGTETNASLQTEDYQKFKQLYQSASRKLTLRMYEGALQDYQEALRLNRDYEESPQLYKGLASSYFALEKYSESALYFEKALKHKATSQEQKAELYYKLASSYNKLGKVNEYKKYLIILKDSFSTSLWGRKAQIEWLKIN